MTLTFEGQPRGTESALGSYSESRFLFSPTPPGSLYLSGGGIAGRPENGTGYLDLPNGGVSFFWNIPPTPTLPSNHFDLLSLEAAAYSAPVTLEVIGYNGDSGQMVTNLLSVSSQSFQTFFFGPSFQNLGHVQILNAGGWSLDNVVIGGVPEPGANALMLLAVATRLWLTRALRRRHA